SVAAAAGLVRGVVQPQPPAVRLEIRPGQASGMDDQAGSPGKAPGPDPEASGLRTGTATLTSFVKRTTKNRAAGRPDNLESALSIGGVEAGRQAGANRSPDAQGAADLGEGIGDWPSPDRNRRGSKIGRDQRG